MNPSEMTKEELAAWLEARRATRALTLKKPLKPTRTPTIQSLARAWNCPPEAVRKAAREALKKYLQP